MPDSQPWADLVQQEMSPSGGALRSILCIARVGWYLDKGFAVLMWPHLTCTTFTLFLFAARQQWCRSDNFYSAHSSKWEFFGHAKVVKYNLSPGQLYWSYTGVLAGVTQRRIQCAVFMMVAISTKAQIFIAKFTANYIAEIKFWYYHLRFWFSQCAGPTTISRELPLMLDLRTFSISRNTWASIGCACWKQYDDGVMIKPDVRRFLNLSSFI